jgi:hypothetical protein
MMSGEHRQSLAIVDKYGAVPGCAGPPREADLTVERSRAAYEPATITSSFLTDLTPGTPEATRAALSRFVLLSAVP